MTCTTFDKAFGQIADKILLLSILFSITTRKINRDLSKLIKMKSILILFFMVILAISNGLPRFEVYWESQGSFLYNDDEQHNPWYIDLAAIG